VVLKRKTRRISISGTSKEVLLRKWSRTGGRTVFLSSRGNHQGHKKTSRKKRSVKGGEKVKGGGPKVKFEETGRKGMEEGVTTLRLDRGGPIKIGRGIP